MLLAHLVEAFGFPGRSGALLSNIQVALFSCWVACLCLLRLEVRMAWVVGRPRRHDLLLPSCFRPVSDPFKQEFMHGAGPYDVDAGDTTEDDIWSAWQSTWHYSSHSSSFLLLHAIAPLHCRGVKSKMHVAFPRGRRYCRGVFTLPVMRLEVRMGRRSAGWACFKNDFRRGRPSGCIQVSAQGSAVFQTIFRRSVGGCGGHVLANMPTFLFSSSSTLGFPGQV